MNICRNNMEDIRQLTEYAHDHRIATDYHINETPMLEQDDHFRHLYDNPTYIRERVTEVECGDGLEDELERIGFVFSWRAGEAVQALAATINLERLETVSAFAFFDSVLAPAFGTGWV